MPRFRAAATNPEATPNLLVGTARMMKLVLGGWKSAAPMPIVAIHSATSESPVNSVNLEAKAKPTQVTIIPAVVSNRAPTLSDTHPDMGEITIEVSGATMRSSPTLSTLRPSTFVR